jgi:hypothetical protein
MSAAAAPAANSGHFTAPAAAPFVVPAAFKRVRAIGAEGKEEHADDNPWVHMQLKDPFTQQQVRLLMLLSFTIYACMPWL